MKKRLLSFLISTAMTLTFLQGFPITRVKAVTTHDISSASIDITTGGEHEITGITTANAITVNSTDDVKIILNNVNIDVSATEEACAFKIANNAGNVTVDLKGTNALKSGAGCAGLQKNPTNTKSLTITSTDGTGSLTATGGYQGAGIGGGSNGSVSNITISGGNVTAQGAAGIGGGMYGSGSDITISGGTVNATGDNAGIGHGGGETGSSSNIKITGGSVKASSFGCTPINDTNTVEKTTITLDGVSAETAVTATSLTGYGTNGVKTDTSGKLYFYLPVSTEVTSVTTAAGTYKGTVTTKADGTATGTFTLQVIPPTISDKNFYANGCPIIIAAGTGDTTTIYWDKNGDGIKDAADTAVSGAENADLSSYIIYGGSETDALTGGTKITMTGGKVSSVIGGGKDGSTTSTSVNINGGTVLFIVCGGGWSGKVSGDTNVNINGGFLNNIVCGGVTMGSDVSGNTNVNINGGTIAGSINHPDIPTNGTAAVKKTTITLDGVLAETALTATSLTGYGTNGVKTDASGNLYFYLPVDTTVTSVTAGGKTYTGTVTTTADGTATGTFTLQAISPTVSGTSVYANGNPIIIAAGTTEGTTTIYWDKNGNGTGDSGEEIADSVKEKDLSSYSIYGGCKTDALTGDTKITMIGGTVNFVYGGGESGTVTGNTSVTISGGTVSGYVYGGGYNSAVSGKTTVNISGGMINSTVYGGGDSGTVTGNTEVTISDGTLNDVYGGGNSGTVTGSTTVNISGGQARNVLGGGNSTTATVGSTNVNISGGMFVYGIFGGGLQGKVTGAASVTISGGTINGGVTDGGLVSDATVGTKNLKITGGTILDTITGSPINDTNTVEKTTITLDGVTAKTSVMATSLTDSYGIKDVKTDASGKLYFYLPVGTTVTSVTTAAGTYKGTVTTTDDGTATGTFTLQVISPTVSGTSVYANGCPIIIAAGTTEGYTTIYWDKNGNGKGDSGEEISGATNVDMSGYLIFGGCKTDAFIGNTKITMTGGKVSRVFGSGNDGAVTGNTSVTINGGTVTYVYGGGNFGTVSGSTTVTINGGTIEKTVLGGGSNGDVSGSTTVTMTGGKVGTVCGGGASGKVTGSATVNISGGTVEGNVFGGGSNTSSDVGSTKITMTGGTVGTVYGGGDNGTVSGDTSVTIGGGMINGTIFGGGNFGTVSGNSTVTINGGTVGYNLLGGGENSAATVGSTNVTINGGTIMGNVDSETYVSGTKALKITGGAIRGAVTGTAKNGLGTTVYKATITLDGVTAETAVTAISLDTTYGIKDIKTDASGIFCLYLPENIQVTSVTAGGKKY